jgi:hypothetical protein
MCGWERPTTPRQLFPIISIDTATITQAYQDFMEARDSLPRRMRYRTEWSQLGSFCQSLPTPIPPEHAQPASVVQFCLHKNATARTQFHARDCPHVGLQYQTDRIVTVCAPSVCPSPLTCPHIPGASPPAVSCPVRVPPSSLKTMLSNLAMAFEDIGRRDPWDPFTARGNPVRSQLVTDYVEMVSADAASALLRPRQALPMAVDKMDTLLVHWDRMLTQPRSLDHPCARLYHLTRYLLVLTAHLAGRRGGDITHLHPNGICWAPDRSGVILLNFEHKTSAKTGLDVIYVPVSSDPLRDWIRIARALASEYRVLSGRSLATAPFIFGQHSLQALSHKRLPERTASKYFTDALKALGIYNQESLYSLRVSGSIAAQAVDIDEQGRLTVAASVMGWSNVGTAARYAQFARAIRHLQDTPSKGAWSNFLNHWCSHREDYLFFATL